jgi:hypothetical protein
MSKDDQPEGEERGKWSPWAIAAAIVLLLIFGIVAVGTFRGYFFVSAEDAAKQEDERKKKEEEEKKQKHEFEIYTPIVMPSDPKSQQPFVKPGHWESTSQVMVANYREFVGDSRLSIVNTQNQPYPVAKTPFELRASRPVLLSKGRPKSTKRPSLFPSRIKISIFTTNWKNAAWATACHRFARRSPRCRLINTTLWSWLKSRRDIRSLNSSTR